MGHVSGFDMVKRRAIAFLTQWGAGAFFYCGRAMLQSYMVHWEEHGAPQIHTHHNDRKTVVYKMRW